MTFKRPSNDLEIKKITLLCCPWNNLQKLSWFLSSNSYNSLYIDEKPVKNIKNDQNDLEMIFKRPSNDLEIKKITLLCCPWNNLQKLSWFLSSNSYNIFFIDERPVFGSMNSHTPFKHDDNVQKKWHHHFFGW